MTMGLSFLFAYMLWRMASAESSLCFLYDDYGLSWHNSNALPLDPNSLGTRDIELYNPNDVITIQASFSIQFAAFGNSFFVVSLRPCWSKAWSIAIAKGNTWGPNLVVQYDEADSYVFHNFATAYIASLNIDDGQYHLLSIVVERINTSSLHFDVSIDNELQISFTFTKGMLDSGSVAVSDEYVMGVNEFGYSRTISLWTNSATVYIESFFVSGTPMQTNRYGACSQAVTKSGDAPNNPQSVSPCDPTASPTVSPTESSSPTTQHPTDTPTTSTITENSTSEPSWSPTARPRASTTSASSTRGEPETTVDETYTTTQSETIEDEHEDEDIQASVPDTSNVDLFMLVVLLFVGVIICLCCLLLLACLYLKRQDKLQENVNEVNALHVVPMAQQNITAKEDSFVLSNNTLQAPGLTVRDCSDLHVMGRGISNTIASTVTRVEGEQRVTDNGDLQRDEFIVEDEEEMAPAILEGPVTNGAHYKVWQHGTAGEYS